MFGSKSAAPRAESSIWLPPVLTQTASKSISLFTAPPGYLVTSNLVDKLLNQGREIFWLRMGPEDRDPGVLLLSLVESLQGTNTGIKASTLTEMQCSPGSIFGWAPLFDQLKEKILDTLPLHSVIVFEHMHFLCDQPSTLLLLENSLLESLSSRFPCILIAHQHLPSASFPIHCILYQPKDLRISPLAGKTLADEAGIDLRSDVIRRLVEITAGRMGALQIVLTACLVLGSRYIENMVRTAKNHHQLFRTLTRELLAGMAIDEQSALFLSGHLKYCHPDISKAVLLKKIGLSDPWGQSLANAWERPLCIWLPYLQMGIKLDQRTKYLILRKAADYLSQQGDILNCFPLYFELKDYEAACRVLIEHCPSMLNLGHWLTLGSWLGQLPKSSLHDHPNLLYVQAELQTANGDFDLGRKTFSMAARMFSSKDDPSGTCESLLAEGTLAAWKGNLDKAQICFLNAEEIAQSANLSQHLGWVHWTQAYFASLGTNPEEALTYINQTIDFGHDPVVKEIFLKVKLLLLRQFEIRQHQEQLYQAYLNLSRSYRETAQSLASFLKSSSNQSQLFDSVGWARLPLILKMPAPRADADQDYALNGTSSSLVMNLIQNLSDFGQRIKKALTNGRAADDSVEDEFPASIAPSGLLNPRKLRDGGTDGASHHASYFVEKPDYGKTLFFNHSEDLTMSAHLLGLCRILLGGCSLDDKIVGRSRAIFQYLLFHHPQNQHREILMSVFWPDAPPDSARNNLNVALHSLRQSLRRVTDLPVIEFHNETYRFNPSLNIWLDVNEFEHHIQAGIEHEQSAAIELAIKEYEIGIDLYQDDFLVDDPYEEWALAPRERLRIAYLNALGNLGQIYFSQERYADCIALCQCILERDNCREDTHCLLMRCYSRSGQRSLALRQYQVCVDALWSELGVDPETETEQLAVHIRSMGDI